MKQVLLAITLSSVIMSMNAQSIKNDNYMKNRFSIEPAIGTRLYSFVGIRDIQLSNIVQYNITGKTSLISHSVFSKDLRIPSIKTVETKHSYSLMQKFGIGLTFNPSKISHSIFLIGGVRYNSYEGKMDNTLLEDTKAFKTNGIAPDYGLLYCCKIGKKRCFFSSRLYMPTSFKSCLDNIMENGSIELGIGFRIK